MSEAKHMTIHSCSYYCHQPECIKAQRDELRDKLYQRTWGRLTDEEIKAASLRAGMQEHYMDFHSGFIRFAQAIEAKLKEKNSA